MDRPNILVLALGGGGDVIASTLFAQMIQRTGARAVVASLAWERFVKDPLPGPRPPADLRNVQLIGEGIGKASPTTAFPNGALVNQAVLCARLDVEEHFILDPSQGVCGLARGLRHLDTLFQFQEAWGLDVGGDVLADSPLPSLRSPLADAMLLSALLQAYPRASVLVVGIGLDAELPREVWAPAVARHIGRGFVRQTLTLPLDVVTAAAPLLDEQVIDSEATAMLIRAYQGMFGRVLVRDLGSIVDLDLTALIGLVYRGEAIARSVNPLPSALEHTESLQEASGVVEAHGFQSEWRSEHEKAATRRGPYPWVDAEPLRPAVLALLGEAQTVHAPLQYVAERYLAERLRVSIASIRNVLRDLYADPAIPSYPPFLALRIVPS